LVTEGGDIPSPCAAGEGLTTDPSGIEPIPMKDIQGFVFCKRSIVCRNGVMFIMPLNNGLTPKPGILCILSGVELLLRLLFIMV
jgi:hypothetical protein